MSIVIPFLAFLLAGAFAAYHRLRLAYWAAISASRIIIDTILRFGHMKCSTTIKISNIIISMCR